MNKLVIVIVGCAVLVAFALPAAAQDPNAEVFPEVNKVVFDHDGKPLPGTPGDPQVIPWYWHPEYQPNGGNAIPNVAGIKFTLKYDPYEVDILGIVPTFGPATGAATQHHRLVPLPDATWPGHVGPTPQSSGQPAQSNSLPGRLAGTIFISGDMAKESGITLFRSEVNYPIFDLQYQPKHTSEARNPQFNSEVDIVVSNLQPIFHPRGGIHNSVWMSQHIPVDDPTGGPLKASDILWTHMNGVPGVFLPNSARYFTSQAASSKLADNPVSGRHVSAVIRPSQWVHVEEPVTVDTVHGQPITFPPSELMHVGLDRTIQLSGLVLPTSVYVVGQAVGGVHTGLGIDHVPEPVSLALLATGGICLLVHASIRRRRRRAA